MKQIEINFMKKKFANIYFTQKTRNKLDLPEKSRNLLDFSEEYSPLQGFDQNVLIKMSKISRIMKKISIYSTIYQSSACDILMSLNKKLSPICVIFIKYIKII